MKSKLLSKPTDFNFATKNIAAESAAASIHYSCYVTLMSKMEKTIFTHFLVFGINNVVHPVD